MLGRVLPELEVASRGSQKGYGVQALSGVSDAPLVSRNLKRRFPAKRFLMYLPSNTPLMKDTQACAVKRAQAGLDRQLCIQRHFAEGRLNIFRDIVSPEQVASQFGLPAAVNAANLQNQTSDARRSAWLYGDGSVSSSKASTVTSPRVYPMNRSGGCSPGAPSFSATAAANPTPGVLPNAPTQLPAFRQNVGGLTGYAPPWSDAFVGDEGSGPGQNDMGVVGWIQSHPWLSLGLVLAGAAAVGAKGRGR